VVDWSDIVAVRDEAPESDARRMTLLGAPDFWLELREPAEVTGPFGIRRSARFLGIGADEPERLRAEIASRLDGPPEPAGR
jgi:hypothetical protein